MSWRRRVGVLLVGAMAAGCGNAAAKDEGDDAKATKAAGDAFPVTIEHRFGTTTIAAPPKRVVTVGLTEQDALLALGVVPVATTEWFGKQPGAVWPWAQDELKALKGKTPASLGDARRPNVEAVAAQHPDLILALYSEVKQEDYDRLSQIAPTVVAPKGYVDYGIPWDELTRTVGKAVGKADQADALVKQVAAKMAATRKAHPEFAGASSVVATPYEGIFVYGPQDVRGRFLDKLGFEMPKGLVAATGGKAIGGNLSAERADLLDVDAIIWLDAGDAEGPLGGPLYAKLPVHTEGREVFLDSYEDPLGAATSFVSVLSLPFLLDGLVPRLAKAIDGDPATKVPASA